jgi:oligopeptide transport system substrate-binding protein
MAILCATVAPTISDAARLTRVARVARAASRAFVVAGLVAIVFHGAIGCGGGGGGGGRDGGGGTPIRIAIEADPATLDPALSVDLHSGRLIPLVALGLVRFDRDLHLAPALAESWSSTEGGRVHTFRLRAGVAFPDGAPLTAAAVKASFERVLDPKTRSPREWLFKRIEGAEAFQRGDAPEVAGIVVRGEKDLEIRLAEPFAPFLSFLAMPQAAILPPALVQSAAASAGAQGGGAAAAGGEGRGAALGETLAGIGPWSLESWRHDDRVVLRTNPKFWTPPRAERLEFRIIPTPSMQMLDFEAARLDVVQVPEPDLARVRANPPGGARLEDRTELAVYYVGLSNDFEPFRDARVRRAMNLGVNVEALFDALAGAGVRARGAIPPGLPGHDASRAPYAYAPDSARALLREAGYANGFSFTILSREGSRYGRALLGVQADLAKIGVTVSVASREWTTLKQTIDNGQAEAFLADWYADYPDGENFLFPLFHSRNIGGGGNRARYRNAEVDARIEEAQREMDPSRREELYREIDARIFADAPWIYLWHPVTTFLVSNQLADFSLHPLFYGEDYTGISRRSP